MASDFFLNVASFGGKTLKTLKPKAHKDPKAPKDPKDPKALKKSYKTFCRKKEKYTTGSHSDVYL